MSSASSGRRRTPWRRSLVASAAIVAFAVACGGGDDVELSAQAENGKQIASRSGCAACHGTDGQGAAGPPWLGLPGTEVPLDDGTVVIADDEYLRRSIMDPSAQRREGAQIQMPANNLSESEVDAVVAYIKELSAARAAESAGG